MTKLSANQEKAIAAIKEHGHIDVSYWGASVFTMSVRGNDRTLKALVRKGILTRRFIGPASTYRYELKETGK